MHTLDYCDLFSTCLNIEIKSVNFLDCLCCIIRKLLFLAKPQYKIINFYFNPFLLRQSLGCTIVNKAYFLTEGSVGLT